MTNLEQVIRPLTTAINGQYPRPWMTSMRDPSRATVFVVGYNPAKPYPIDRVPYERHIDALFNRNGETCRGLYSEVTNESPTRGNIELLTAKLASLGITSVLETNVVCYSTGKKRDLGSPAHAGGKARGLELFRALVHEIRPKVIVVHGKGVRDEFNRAFTADPPLPSPPDRPDLFVHQELSGGTRVFVIPSLALPGYQNWPPLNSFCNWAAPYLDQLAARIVTACTA
jgi:hypothetical protein